MFHRRALGILVLLAASLLALSNALAAPFNKTGGDGFPIIPLVHTRWLVKDGAPPSVVSMAQSPDGWLWLAGTAGLWRFDGMTFSRYRPSNLEIKGSMYRVGVLSDGTVWASGVMKGLYFVRGSVAEYFDESSGMAKGNTLGATRDNKGRTWIATTGGLYLLDPASRRWAEAGTALGLPPGKLDAILLDSRGTMWLLAPSGVFSLAPGATRVVRVQDQQGQGDLKLGADGSVWATDLLGRTRQVSGHTSGKVVEDMLADRKIMELMFDRKGNVWLPQNSGIHRLDLQDGTPHFQHFRSQHGLSGPYTRFAFEDREGSIWVSTPNGLDQFRPSRVRSFTLPLYIGEARPLAVGPDGQLWIDRMYFADAESEPRPYVARSSPDSMVTTLYRDPDGVVWRGGTDGLFRMNGLESIKIPYTGELAVRKSFPLLGIAKDDAGALWVSLGVRGTYRYKDGLWTPYGGVAGLKGFPTLAIVAGPKGSLWFGSLKGLAILRDGKVRHIDIADGLDIGGVLHILPFENGAYLGGETGIAYFDGARARTVLGKGGEQFPGASGIVITSPGDMWAFTAKGLVWITAAELARSRSQAGYQPRFRIFDENDGVNSRAISLLPIPSMVQSSTGELIISASGYVFRFDPSRLDINRLVPPVHVTSLTAGESRYLPGPALTLPAAPDTVRIDYTALSLAVPQRVRFRYRLEGVDRHWQEAGGRRSAFYTQLAPGKYTFRVIAANNDGIWNEDGARVDFVIPPTWTQSVWFKLLCALALAATAWLLHRLRLRIALRRYTVALDARMAERERIARDLHDTLLQSVQGLILTFKRVANRISNDPPTRTLANQALALANDVLIEGRNKVGGLRAGHDGGDLVAALDVHGQKLSEQYGPRFVLTCSGAVQLLQPAVFDEVLAIGREAIQNAFVHAHATAVRVELEYGAELFKVRITDDGRGIDQQYREGRNGHWGIRGMRERAVAVSASLKLLCDKGQGCSWELCMASHNAYALRRGIDSHSALDSHNSAPVCPAADQSS